MDNIHIKVSMGVAMVSVVDGFSEGLVIQRIIQSKWEDLVEDIQNLRFEVGRVDLGSDVVKNVLDIFKVSLVVRIHSGNGHSVLRNGDIIHVFGWN